MDDSDGHVTAAIASFSVVSLLFAPFYVGIALMRLFFRAPLAAVIGGIFFAALTFIGMSIGAHVLSDMHPIGAIFAGFLMLAAAAGACFGALSAGLLNTFFDWECKLLYHALANGGAFGRVVYIVAQSLPGIALAAMLIALSLDDGGPRPNLDNTLLWLLGGWLAWSQYSVYQFHRTNHPVGQFVTFYGRPRPEMAEVETEAV